jgi:hypothetical protein
MGVVYICDHPAAMARLVRRLDGADGPDVMGAWQPAATAVIQWPHSSSRTKRMGRAGHPRSQDARPGERERTGTYSDAIMLPTAYRERMTLCDHTN